MLLTIIVPCYNEKEALPHLMPRLSAVLDGLPGMQAEILLVDDGSTDGTLSLAKALAHADKRVRVFSFSRNFGKEAALLMGLREARGSLVAVMDADLQDPPELLPTMISLLDTAPCDCVATRRITRRGEPPIRSLFARGFYGLINRVSQVEVVGGARDFRLMRREMVDAILSLPEKRRFSKGLFAWVGFSFRYLAYDNVERVAGVTKWSFFALFRYAIEGICSLTGHPLFLSYMLGGFCALAALTLCLFAAYAPALLCALGALILLAIGVVGQVIHRIGTEARGRPLYIAKRDSMERKAP